MTSFSATWNKPARERHAHVGDVLRKLLGRAPKAAIELCLYLFEYCIDGKFEEIELYELPLGEERDTEIRGGKRYARNTLREALNHLVRLGLVVIKKSYGRGVFLLTISHPGEKRPFDPSIKNPTPPSQFRPLHLKTDKTQPETPIPSFPITEDLINKAESTPAAIDLCCLPPPPEPQSVAQAPPCQEPLRSPLPNGRSALDMEPPPALTEDNHEGEGGRMIIPPLADILPSFTRPSSAQEECSAFLLKENIPEGVDPSAYDDSELPRKESNPDACQILCALRDVMALNPQIRKEVLKYSLHEVVAAITLYRERTQRTPVRNVGGWLTDALRGRWAMLDNDIAKATEAHRNEYPPELSLWYDWATSQGIVCPDIPLHLCLTHSPGSPGGIAQAHEKSNTLVPLMLPPEKRRPGFAPYEHTPWREALARFPMPSRGG